jgi:hypothetical protein
MPKQLTINGKIFVPKVSGTTKGDAEYHAYPYRRDHYVRIIKRKIRNKIEREMVGYDTTYVVYVSKRRRKK